MTVNQEAERPTPGRPASTEDAGPPRRWWALAALALTGLTIGIQSTVTNIALPQLSTALHATTGQLQWIASAFTLVAGVGMLPAAAGLAAGATTGTGTGYGFAAGWIALLGLGVGIALPAALNAALGALPTERAGAGSGLMQAMRQVGGTIGVAVLGTVPSSGYRGRARTGHLPAALAGATRDSVAAGMAVAGRLHDTGLAQVVRAAFVHGMDLTLIVSGAVVAVGAQ